MTLSHLHSEGSLWLLRRGWEEAAVRVRAVPAMQVVAAGLQGGGLRTPSTLPGRPGQGFAAEAGASERNVKPSSADPAALCPGVREPLTSVTVFITESRADFLAVIIKMPGENETQKHILCKRATCKA